MDLYGLIGCPLEHSFSYRFFNEKFKEECISANYQNFEVNHISLLTDILSENSNLQGLNVTIPYKEEVMSYLNNVDEDARQIGAVNVIRREIIGGEDILTGYNTDVIGFQQSLQKILIPELHKKALILGTGGASKAVARALQNLNIEYQFVSRSLSEKAITYSELNKELMNDYKLIVNASPVGTYPNVEESPNIPYEYLNENHLLFDLVYNPEKTAFLKRGEGKGATIKNGYEMLELQALAAWEIWNK